MRQQQSSLSLIASRLPIAIAAISLVAGVALTTGCGDKKEEEAKPEKVAEGEKKEDDDKEGGDEASDDKDEDKDKAADDKKAQEEADKLKKETAEADKELEAKRAELEKLKKELEETKKAGAAAVDPADKTAAAGDQPESCTKLLACCGDLEKMAPDAAKGCGTIKKALENAPAIARGMACDQGVKAIGSMISAIPGAPASCTALATAAPEPAKAAAAPTTGPCAQLVTCCDDVSKSNPTMGQACGALKTALGRLPEGQRDMFCGQSMQQMSKTLSALPAVPDSCKAKPEGGVAANPAQPANPGQPTQPADGATPTPTPAAGTAGTAGGTQPAAGTTGGAAGADSCAAAKACCAELTKALPQIGKACDTLKMANQAPLCDQVLKSLKQAAGALPQLGKTVPEACK